MAARSIVFPPFRLDLGSQCLWRGTERVELAPKALAVLLQLLERPGELLSKSDLLEAVWPDTFVSEAVLKVCVGEIRKALGDASRAPQFIETAHRRGYRFIGPVEIASEAPATAPLARHHAVPDMAGLYVPAVEPVSSLSSPFLAPPAGRQPVGWPPKTRYAHGGDVNIAYQVIGNGPLDLVFVMGWVSHVEYFWAEPTFARFLLRLASFSRLILFDKRGTGLSDRVPPHELPTLEQRMDDLRAVLDAVGSERAALCGVSEGGPMSALFAATYPEKTTALAMIGTYAKRVRSPDYPWAPTAEERDRFCEQIQRDWGEPLGLEERAPSMAGDPAFQEWWATYLRMGASPAAAVALTRMNAEVDVRHVLPSIRIPTLVLHREGDRCLKVEEGRYVASRIPGARLVELPGDDHLPFVGDQDAILDEMEEFLTGVRHSPEPDRTLATLLFIEFRDGGKAARRPDQWPRLEAHVRRELEWYRGREMAGADGPLAVFDGPARAVRCACALAEHAARLGLGMRAGLHTGECDLMDDAVGGMAVGLAQGVLSHAASGEVLVSSTVRDLVAGSGIRFAERGWLGGSMPEREWRLYAVERHRH